MVYIFQDGRVLFDSVSPNESEKGKYLEFDTLPQIPEIADKIGYISGCNLETGEAIFGYSDIPALQPEPTEVPEPTETERIMQGFTDSELRDLEIQQNQELLAQQITDIEVALLGGDR